MNLYYVQAEDDDGHDYDLLVQAEQRAQVPAMWREHYELYDDEASGIELAVSQVVVIPGVAGPLGWYGMDGPGGSVTAPIRMETCA